MVIVLIIAIVRQTTTGIKKVTKKTAQVIEASHNRIIKNIKDFHRNVMSVITIATNTTDRTNHKEQAMNKQENYNILLRHVKTQQQVRRIVPVTHIQDLQPLRQLTRPVAAQVSAYFTQRPNVETETPEHKILNSTLVTTNEALNSTCKYSVNHAPSHTSHRNSSG